MKQGDKKKITVVLMAMGGPSSKKDILLFLYLLFSDKAIFNIPFGIRQFFAVIFSLLRYRHAKNNYAYLGGGSPILSNTLQQAKSLEQELDDDFDVHCFVLMRYTQPDKKEVINQINSIQSDCIIKVPMYPQFSNTTTQSSLIDFENKIRKKCQIRQIPYFFDCSFFYKPIKDEIIHLYEKSKRFGIPVVLLSAHGIPQRNIDRGDPYQKQCEKTAEILRDELSHISDNIVLCYQSKVGPIKWIGPSLEYCLTKFSSEHRPLIIIPISFVCEHVETLVELHHDAIKTAKSYGCPSIFVGQTLGCNPVFIRGLADKIKDVLVDKE